MLLNMTAATVLALGVAGSLLGSISMVLGIAAIARHSSVNVYILRLGGSSLIYPIYHLFTLTAQGIWAGLFLLITGIVGILAKSKKSRPLCLASGILGIFSASICSSAFGLSGRAILSYSFRVWSVEFISIHVAIATLCLAGISLSIVQSVFSFMTMNRDGYSQEGRVVYAQHGSTPANTQLSTQPTGPLHFRKVFRYILFVTGIIEIMFGFLSLALDSYALNLTITSQATVHVSWLAFGYNGKGIWGGIFLIISGCLGAATKSHPSVTLFNLNMVASMFAATTSAVMCCISGIAAVSSVVRLVHLQIVLATFGLLSMITCIVHSACSCGGICSARGSEPDIETITPAFPAINPAFTNDTGVKPSAHDQ